MDDGAEREGMWTGRNAQSGRRQVQLLARLAVTVQHRVDRDEFTLPARRLRREQGLKLATAHVRHLNPLPGNLGEVLRSFQRVLVPEMNMGQLARLLRAEYLVDVDSYTKVDGLPIFTRDVMEQVEERLA